VQNDGWGYELPSSPHQRKGWAKNTSDSHSDSNPSPPQPKNYIIVPQLSDIDPPYSIPNIIDVLSLLIENVFLLLLIIFLLFLSPLAKMNLM